MTTIPVSTVPVVKAYLLTEIQAAIADDPKFNDMVVQLGSPGQYVPNDTFYIGEVIRTVDHMDITGDMGQDSLQESYDILVTVASWSAYGDSDDSSTVALAVDARAWQLNAYMETAVRSDPTFGLTQVILSYPRESHSDGPEWTAPSVGLRVGIQTPIHVEATL
jgi:hypothetical protein